MAIELEVKLAASEEILQQLRSRFCHDSRQITMRTTYYDTPEGDLSAQWFTLRQRQENEESVCTLKIPAQEGRNEFEVLCGDIFSALPELCKLSGQALPQVAEKGLVAVCSARFTRIAQDIPWGNSLLELALDQGQLIGGDKTIPLCEVEVELKQGDPAALAAFAALLQSDYPLKPEKKSKFRRALALAKGE